MRWIGAALSLSKGIRLRSTSARLRWIGIRTREGAGTRSVRGIIMGVVGGIIGGLLFTLLVAGVESLPNIARLIQSESIVAGLVVWRNEHLLQRLRFF